MEIDYSIYHNAIKTCIEAHKSRLDTQNMKKFEAAMGKFSLVELRTLLLSFGRACGHTTYILENALPNDLIVVAKASERIFLEYKYEPAHQKYDILTVSDIVNQKFCGMGHSAKRNVWINGNTVYSSLWSRESEYMAFLMYFRPEQIIVLGE